MNLELRDVVAWFRDRSVSIASKLVGLFALVYAVSPIDLIPDFIPVIGWLDDLGVIALTAAFYVRQIRLHRNRRLAAARTIGSAVVRAA